MAHAYYQYLPVEGAELFTVVLLPAREGRFPVVLMRSPYVDHHEEKTEEELCAIFASGNKWLEQGYAVIHQDCRGRGKSSGDCVPYIYEREDGLALQAWVREQSFYNGELYLVGGSYTSSVHFVTAPFAPDIKGAILEVQDCERYNCNYRNGFYKVGLHGGWYVNMYKRKTLHGKKHYGSHAYHMLPLADFSKTVFDESAPDFDETLRHPKRDDPFWRTRYGGGEAHNAIRHANIPILLITGFYDIYTGGVFDMWSGLDDATRAKSALLVHPFAHSGKSADQPIAFPNGEIREAFGDDYKRAWLNAVRGKGAFPAQKGKVTYYALFENRWCTNDFKTPAQTLTFSLGEGEWSYRYNPWDPPTFPGGLSANFGGAAWQKSANWRHDVRSIYTPAFEKDITVRGKMRAQLRVRSTAEDTCFYVRVSIQKEQGDFGLRDDIQQISNFVVDYRPGDIVDLEFSFDEHAFLVQAGERLRVDIASASADHYVRHTNRKGLFSEQTGMQIADNTVVLDESWISFPVENAEA